MKTTSTIKQEVKVSAKIRRKDGTTEDLGQINSKPKLIMGTVFTDTGKAQVVKAVNGDTYTAPTHVGWQTGSGDASESDTALDTEASEAREVGTASIVQTNVAGDTRRVVATLTVAGADKTITGIGLFDALTGGNLFLIESFPGLALKVGDSVEFTIDQVLSQA